MDDIRPTRVTTSDYHTAGEPYRIVTGGVPRLEGETVLDKRSDAQARFGSIRAFLVNEPRGHADMYGCFVTEPDDEAGAFGMVFFHADGFSTACGHGTIAGTTWALESGLVPMVEPVTSLLVDVPSGRLTVEADVSRGRVGEVRFTNVESWVSALDLEVELASGPVLIDVAYGGAFYGVIRASDVGLSAKASDLVELIGVGREIKSRLDETTVVDHPDDSRLSGCYGVIFFDDLGGDSDLGLEQRNVTIFADGEVDRSPCGSGTSARLAVLDRRGDLQRGSELVHWGVAGAKFVGRVVGEGAAGVFTQVGGRASLTGEHTFIMSPGDEIGLGFLLR